MQCRAEYGQGVNTGISHATCENRDTTCRTVLQTWKNRVHLLQGHNRRDIQLHALPRQTLHQWSGTSPVSVRDWNLHVNVLTPACDSERLGFHLIEIVGKDFERERTIRNLT